MGLGLVLSLLGSTVGHP